MTSYRARRRKSRTYDTIWFYIVTIFFCVVIVMGLFVFIGHKTTVDGDSMNPTLVDGDQLILDKISYRLQKEKRYDIVVFRKPGDESTYLVKRLIGLPGERILIENGTVYVNGKELSKDYSLDGYTTPLDMTKEIVVPKDSFFVLGDNRGNSMDSRDLRIGCISKKKVIGKVMIRVYPFSKIGKIK